MLDRLKFWKRKNWSDSQFTVEIPPGEWMMQQKIQFTEHGTHTVVILREAKPKKKQDTIHDAMLKHRKQPIYGGKNGKSKR